MTELETLKQELLTHYVDKHGMVTPQRDPGVDYVAANGTLYTSEAYFLLTLLGVIDSTDIINFSKVIESVTVKPGLYNRYPELKMLEAHDNYLGICAFTKLIRDKNVDYKIPYEVYEWGKNHMFLGLLPVYNNLEPEKFKIEALRQGSHWGFIKYCAGKRIGILCSLWLIGGIICSMYDKETSTKVLSILQLQVLKKHSFVYRWLNRWFYWKVDFKGTVNTYFGEGIYSKLFGMCEGVFKSSK
jgi:hypothetical protein